MKTNAVQALGSFLLLACGPANDHRPYSHDDACGRAEEPGTLLSPGIAGPGGCTPGQVLVRFEYDESIMPVVWYRVGDEGVAHGLQAAPGERSVSLCVDTRGSDSISVHAWFRTGCVMMTRHICVCTPPVHVERDSVYVATIVARPSDTRCAEYSIEMIQK